MCHYLLPLLLCAALAAAEERVSPISIPESISESLVFGVRAGMPAGYFDSESPQANALSLLVDEIFRPVGIQLVYKELPRRRVIHGALKGEIAMLTLPVVVNPDTPIALPDGLVIGREALFSFNLNIYALKTRQLKFTRLADIQGVKLGVIKDAKFLDQAISNASPSVEQLETFNLPTHLLKALLAERVDIVLMAEPVMKELLQQLKPPQEVEAVFTVGRSGRHLVFSEAELGNRATTLRDYSDKRLQQLKRSGFVAETLQGFNR